MATTTTASWGGGRLRVRSSINYTEQDENSGDFGRGEEEEEGPASTAGGRDSFHEDGSSANNNACGEARQQRPARRHHHRSGKKVFKRFPLKQKVRPLRQVEKNGTAVVHHTNRHHTNRVADRQHTNHTAYIGDTARYNAVHAQLSLLSATSFFCERSTCDFKGQNESANNNDNPNPSIQEILCVLQHLEEDTKISTKRRRPRAGKVAIPPWLKRSPPDAALPEKASGCMETLETKPCIVSLETAGVSLSKAGMLMEKKIGMPLGEVDTTSTTAGRGGALDVLITAGATAIFTPTRNAPTTSSTSAVFARRIKMEEEEWTGQDQQTSMGGTKGAAAAADAGRSAPFCRRSVETADTYVAEKGAAATALPSPSSQPPGKVFDALAVKKQPCEGNRLAWQRPPLPSTIETKPRRGASGPSYAGRVAYRRRAGSASKAERRRDDNLRVGGGPKTEMRDDDLRRGGSPKTERRNGDLIREGAVPKAEDGNEDLQEAAGSTGVRLVRGAPVAVAPVAVEVCGGRCGRYSARCERCRSDAVGDLSEDRRSMPPPPPRRPAVAVTVPSTESSLTSRRVYSNASFRL